jgi:hypothetical protein
VSDVITAHRPADESTLRFALRKVPTLSIVIVGYFVIGFVAFWPVLPWNLSHQLFAGLGDYAQSVWFLGWVPHALAHGLNPFFSDDIFVPTGVNLAQNTESPLLGLVAAPITEAFSPLVTANVLVVLAMPLSATAAFVVLRKWSVWGPAAALGGLVYGFSPYMVAQSLAHVELLFVPLPPFIALTVASIMGRRGPPRRLGVQLGLLFTAQYLISPEVCTVVAIFTAGAVAFVALRHRSNWAEVARTVGRPVGIALVVTAVLLAYPVWMLLAGPQHFTGRVVSTTNPFHNDLLNFVVPGPEQRVSLGMRALGARLDGNGNRVDEAGAYIGVPVLILAATMAWRSRRSLRMQLAIIVLLAAALLSLGPHLAVDGRLSSIPLPYLLFDHLPLLDNILPIRICFELGAGLAAVLAFGLDDMRRAPARDRPHERSSFRGRGNIVLAGLTIAVVVVTQLPRWPHSAPPAPDVLPTAISRAVPGTDPVAVTYPYDTAYTMLPMVWQAEDGYRFRLVGGYGYHPDAPGNVPDLFPAVMNPPNLQQFLAGQDIVTALAYPLYGAPLPVTPRLVASTRTTLSRYHVRLVIVDRSVGGSAPVMELFNDALGPPTASAGRFSLWADWHGPPPRHQVFPSARLATSIEFPASGARLSGTKLLDAKATDGSAKVTKVEFVLTGRSVSDKVIAVASRSLFGWIAKWNTAGLADGTYTLQSVAYDSANRSSRSRGTRVVVDNN